MKLFCNWNRKQIERIETEVLRVEATAKEILRIVEAQQPSDGVVLRSVIVISPKPVFKE